MYKLTLKNLATSGVCLAHVPLRLGGTPSPTCVVWVCGCVIKEEVHVVGESMDMFLKGASMSR